MKVRTPEAAAHCGLSASTLEKYRLNGTGPVYFKAGPKIVLYETESLDQWLHARRRTSTSDVGARRRSEKNADVAPSGVSVQATI